MFEKLKNLFKCAPRYTTRTLRVYNKKHAKPDHVYLVIAYKDEANAYSNACQIPFGISDDQRNKVAEMLWSGMKDKYKL